jgi:hypothetical protein
MFKSVAELNVVDSQGQKSLAAPREADHDAAIDPNAIRDSVIPSR